MMNAAFAAIGKSAVYFPFPVEPHLLLTALNGLAAVSAVGVNVTIPHKVHAFDWVTHKSEEALRVGAINTIRFDATNGATGHNTDVVGWWTSIAPAIAKFTGSLLQIAVIGSGGASMAILAAISLYARDAQVRLIARNVDVAEALVARYREVLNVSVVAWSSRNEAIASAQLVVNTTPLGMWPQVDGSPVDDASVFHSGQVVQDIVYRPEKTQFLRQAEASGSMIVDGLGMLIHQGAAAFEWWFSEKAPVDVMGAAARTQLAKWEI